MVRFATINGRQIGPGIGLIVEIMARHCDLEAVTSPCYDLLA